MCDFYGLLQVFPIQKRFLCGRPLVSAKEARRGARGRSVDETRVFSGEYKGVWALVP